MPEVIINADELSEEIESEDSSIPLTEEPSETFSSQSYLTVISEVFPEDNDEDSYDSDDYEPFPEPANDASELSQSHILQAQLLSLAKNIMRSEGLAFWGAITLYQLMSTIAEGFTDQTVALERNFARYQIPAIAIPTTLVASMHHSGLAGINKLHQILVAALSGSGSAAFNLLLSMELITVIFRAVNSALKGNQVDISDALAWSDIAFCGLTGLGESLQVYYEQCNTQEPQALRHRLNRIMTSRTMRGIYGGLNTASAFHAASFVMMSSLNSNTKLIDGAPEFYTRLGITIASGVAGGFLYSHENANELLAANALKASVTLMQIICLAFFAAGMYFLPEPRETFGFDLRLEQLILWLLVEPLLSIITAVSVNLWNSNRHSAQSELTIVDPDEMQPILDTVTRPQHSYSTARLLANSIPVLSTPKRLVNSLPNLGMDRVDSSDDDERLQQFMSTIDYKQ